MYAQSNEHRFKESSVAHGTSNRIDLTRRISRKLDDLGDLSQEIRCKMREILPAMFETLGNKPFNPTFELELVAHGDGAFFARHLDTLTGPERRDTPRIISTVYYFHVLPKAFSGGVLRLHSLAASGQQGTFADIPPDYDTLVFFPSMFPHEVLPVKSPSGRFLDSRFAINCWIYGDASPKPAS
jgi:Rps23 Pro-64 3,4-dihydroxylase Tpa1-like proline 4-hydroxylase